MAQDFEDSVDLATLSDDEIYDRIVERLREDGGMDPELLDIDVREGRVTVSGRLGSESEARVVDHVLTDRVGIVDYDNQIVVDALARDETSEDTVEAAEDQDAEDEEGRLGEDRGEHSDTAAHLDEDVERRAFGTRDPGVATEEGTPYTPPDRPTPEGREGR